MAQLLERRRHAMDGKQSLPAMKPATARVIALIPARDETGQIADTLASLRAQERRPDRIIVIADNCTDETAAFAHLCGADIVETRDNAHRKAGALNQVLDRILPDCGPDDAILVMDADSTLHPGFVVHALAYLATGRYAAVGGTFEGKPGGGLVGMFQRNEYARYARDVRRLGGKALVLSGTATLFRAHTLREIVRARSEGRLPGAPHVYDVRVLTEDNELTLAILHLRMRILCPIECTLATEVMPSWGDLFRQRLRWKRGALENLIDYGWTPVTRRYWGRQLLALTGLAVIGIYLASIATTLAATGSVPVSPFWVGVTGVFAIERAVTVRARGAAQMCIAAVLLVEMAFDVFLQAVQLRAFCEAALHTERKW